MSIENPTKIIPAFYSLYTEPWDIFIAHGGRGSGKSVQITDYLTRENARRHCRTLCCREIQRSMDESVFALLRERITEMGREDEFRVLEKSIRGTFYNSPFIFSGLREHTASSIKSLANINNAWIEEAQDVTSRSLEILLPTIRSEGSKIIMSYNRQMDSDPCHRYAMAGITETRRLCYTSPKGKKYYWFEHRGIDEFKNPHTGKLERFKKIVVNINYDGNPFFPMNLEQKRLACLRDTPDEYPHIWLGQPVGSATYSILPREKVMGAVGREIPKDDGGMYFCGVDVAGLGRDRTVAYLRKGMRSIAMETWREIEGPAICDHLELFAKDQGLTKKNVTWNVDDTGLGFVAAEMVRRGWRVNGLNFGGKAEESETYPNIASELWFTSREKIDIITIINDPELIDELSRRRWKPHAGGKRVVEPKDEYKKREGKSPDKADSFNLAFYDHADLHLKPGESLAGAIKAY